MVRVCYRIDVSAIEKDDAEAAHVRHLVAGKQRLAGVVSFAPSSSRALVRCLCLPPLVHMLRYCQSGACAGLAVDVSLFPIDTLKTRMQAPEGFFKAGGFRGIYNGLSAAAAGSMPGGTY